MADVVVVDIPVDTWVKVATSTSLCNLAVKEGGYKYYHTERDTGGGAPTAPSGKVPEEALRLFNRGNQDLIVTNVDSDIYVCCFVDDSNISDGTGKVRVGA